jgi:hypothetical protein
LNGGRYFHEVDVHFNGRSGYSCNSAVLEHESNSLQLVAEQ